MPVNEAIDLSDQFQDLVEFAKAADQTKGMNRAWPLPFTIEVDGPNEPHSQAVGRGTRFVFTCAGLAAALQGEDASLKVPTPDSLKQKVKQGKGIAKIYGGSGDRTFLVKRWSRVQYLRRKAKEDVQCRPEAIRVAESDV